MELFTVLLVIIIIIIYNDIINFITMLNYVHVYRKKSKSSKAVKTVADVNESLVSLSQASFQSSIPSQKSTGQDKATKLPSLIKDDDGISAYKRYCSYHVHPVIANNKY